MPTYLERYTAGEYEQVWSELVALGPAVREDAVFPDAWGVAQETMRRARTNIERIIEHLQTIGYRFEHAQPFEPPDNDLIAEVKAFEKNIGPVPLSVRAWIEIVGTVDLVGTFPGLSYYEPPITFPQVDFMAGVEKLNADELLSKLQNSMSSIDASMLGPLKNLLNSLSNLQQQMQDKADEMSQEAADASPIAPEEQVLSDPLVVWMGDLDGSGYREWEDDESEDFILMIAPNADGKANMGGDGGYEIRLPSAAADAPLKEEPHETTFVNYLRIAFQWGGFPGLEGQEQGAAAYLNDIRPKMLPL